MDTPADLRIQAAGWRLLAEFYGPGGQAMLETARFLDARADQIEVAETAPAPAVRKLA